MLNINNTCFSLEKWQKKDLEERLDARRNNTIN
jgi:hypothetical protein